MPADPPREEEKAAPRRQPVVAEREPLSIVVVDTPAVDQVVRVPSTAETRVRTATEVEIPAEVPRRRWPYFLVIAAVAAVTFSSYRMVFRPAVLRVVHGIERRVLGDRSYSQPRPPKVKWPQS